MIIGLLVAGLLLAALSGFPAFLLERRSLTGQRVATALLAVGSLLGISAAVLALFAETPLEVRVPWPVPGGEFCVVVDGIASLFLIQIFLVSSMGSLYGLSYWKQTEHQDDGRKLTCVYGLLTFGLGLLVIAKNGLLFLTGWEIMALAAFMAVTTQDRDPEVARAGFVYLCATRIGTLCLFAFFSLLCALSGRFEFAAPSSSASPGLVTATFVLGLFGFGLKAGVMPLHLWLPGAHANAPSHVSALMSGVMIKAGVYGLVRTCSLFPDPPLWWGQLIIVLGAVSGVLGVAFAIGQHDIKRLLAYHSVENIGIIAIGLGLATMGRSLERTDLILTGIAGALLHVINHGLFKALLFLGAGSVLHSTGTRDIDRLGGLLRRMPRTALAFLIGAVAICGLPPLNGFVSELLIYVGLLRSFTSVGTDEGALVVALAVPALALIGALAVACFVKVFGTVFLGVSRSPSAERAHDADRLMAAPMVILAASCALIGLAPIGVAPLLANAAGTFARDPSITASSMFELVSFPILSLTGGALLLLLLVGWRILASRIAAHPVESSGTWDCGYAAPSPRMQYTSSSFAEMLVRLFAFALRPQRHRPRFETPFPSPQSFTSHIPEPILDYIALPGSTFLARFLQWFRWLQAGSVQAYVLYVLITLVALLLFS